MTEPPLTSQIYEEVMRNVRTPGFHALGLQLLAGCLVIHSPRFTPELRADLEQLLANAEEVILGASDRARRQAENEQSEKQITLESAASGFGLPIA